MWIENVCGADIVPVTSNRPMITAKVRKIIKTGASYYIALPQEFIKRYNFKPGDKVGVLSDSIVKVIPMNEI